MVPAKRCLNSMCSTRPPNLPWSSEAPMTATVVGLRSSETGKGCSAVMAEGSGASISTGAGQWQDGCSWTQPYAFHEMAQLFLYVEQPGEPAVSAPRRAHRPLTQRK